MDRYEIGTLRSYYGLLLTERQNEMLRLHYDEDISYGELSEMFGVSRQAVLDSIKRGEKTLTQFEEKLRLAYRENALLAKLDGALADLDLENTRGAAEKIKAAKTIMEE